MHHANTIFSKGYSEDISSHKVYEPIDGWSSYQEHLSQDVAEQAVKELVGNQLSCSEDLVLENGSCNQIHPKTEVSQVCYFDSNVGGYFIASKDYLENINIIYNRYD